MPRSLNPHRFRIKCRDVGRMKPPPNRETSMTLLARAQAGDQDALNTLLDRYRPRLHRWARGRLPNWARDLADTHDLVQETLVQAFKKVEGFEVRGDGAFQAWLRQILLNRIRQEIRRASRRPAADELDTQVEDEQPSPLETAVGREALGRYEDALSKLTPADREIVIARVELGQSNEEIAQAFGKPSANAARMAVERALLRLAREMRHRQ
jgi:RNA polymerase sigma factor (sigma-70 family)